MAIKDIRNADLMNRQETAIEKLEAYKNGVKVPETLYKELKVCKNEILRRLNRVKKDNE